MVLYRQNCSKCRGRSYPPFSHYLLNKRKGLKLCVNLLLLDFASLFPTTLPYLLVSSSSNLFALFTPFRLELSFLPFESPHVPRLMALLVFRTQSRKSAAWPDSNGMYYFCMSRLFSSREIQLSSRYYLCRKLSTHFKCELRWHIVTALYETPT